MARKSLKKNKKSLSKMNKNVKNVKSNKKNVKRAHPFLLEISKIYKIIDNPNLVCIPVINFD